MVVRNFVQREVKTGQIFGLFDNIYEVIYGSENILKHYVHLSVQEGFYG